MKKNLIKKIKLNKKFGFTLVEVTLFLALSSSIMLGIILATNASVARQRYSDSFNDFADFLRGVYSSVMDVEHSGSGNQETAVYGKFITFQDTAHSGTSTIHVYTIRGKAINSSNANDFGVDTKEILANRKTNPNDFKLTVSDETYHTIPWGAVIEKPNNSGTVQNCPSDNVTADASSGCFVGSVLIVRSPISGIVQTYTSTTKYNPSGTVDSNHRTILGQYIDSMSSSDLDFCIDSDDNSYANRRNIRLLGSGINSTAVVMVEMDNEGDSKCLGK
ncbi:hypothetical protein IJI70_01035 [Candidatus Saccharibacteria bacterium]|nr:hypothetical protein [Candidatus Saccharibacteria bacterium]